MLYFPIASSRSHPVISRARYYSWHDTNSFLKIKGKRNKVSHGVTLNYLFEQSTGLNCYGLTIEEQLNNKAMKQKTITLWGLLLVQAAAVAQTPDLYPPTVPEPMELSLFNIILYIVIPVLLVIFLVYYRRRKRKK